MVREPSSLIMINRMDSGRQNTRGRLTKVFILFSVCCLLTACYTFRSADCDTIQKAEERPPVSGRAVVSGIVGKGEPIKGTGWFLREHGTRGIYDIQFDPPLSATPRCCVETQELSASKLSVEVMSTARGLHLEATHESERCLRKEKQTAYGYVVGERCTVSETVHLHWDGHLKFTCVSQ
jgi:hypothetical protein